MSLKDIADLFFCGIVVYKGYYSQFLFNPIRGCDVCVLFLSPGCARGYSCSTLSGLERAKPLKFIGWREVVRWRFFIWWLKLKKYAKVQIYQVIWWMNREKFSHWNSSDDVKSSDEESSSFAVRCGIFVEKRKAHALPAHLRNSHPELVSGSPFMAKVGDSETSLPVLPQGVPLQSFGRQVQNDTHGIFKVKPVRFCRIMSLH